MNGRPGVIVSGASTGIGEATATLLGRSGFVAFAGVRSEADANRLSAAHENVRPLFLEVTEPSSIASAIREVSESGTPLVGVVSNAGIALGGPLEHVPTADFRRVLEVNVVGALAVAQAALPLLPAPEGRIVFVGSIAGRLAMPYNAAYSASKFALRALADALRIELAPAGLFVSLIESGSARTAIWRKGRASREALFAMLREGARPHYYRAVETILRNADAEERTGIAAERVARAAVHALSATRPRARYVLGSARGANVLALLPLRLRDRIVRATQGF